jgi:hypothetical protein
MREFIPTNWSQVLPGDDIWAVEHEDKYPTVLRGPVTVLDPNSMCVVEEDDDDGFFICHTAFIYKRRTPNEGNNHSK